MHIVTLDSQYKIAQIRLHWDQASLLKQLGIIGNTGRNWPIKEGKDQIAMIKNCLKRTGMVTPTPSESHKPSLDRRDRGNSTNATRDPYASLHMMGSREEREGAQSDLVVSTKAAGHRPKQRSFADVLGDEPGSDEDGEMDASPSQKRSMSPTKGGSGKNFQPMRLFDGQEHTEEVETPKAGTAFIRPHATKYSHFDFADGSDPQDAPKAGVALDEKPKSKHDSQWSFQDFVTPAKLQPGKAIRSQDIRHWDTDRAAMGETPAPAKPQPGKAVRSQDVRHWDTDRATMGETPAPTQGKGRRDAETHFELQDDGEKTAPDVESYRPRGSTHNEGLNLYKHQFSNNSDEEDQTPNDQRPLGNITNLKDRGKDFEAHFSMTDDSPSGPQKQPGVSEGRMKAVKNMGANWSSYDESPQKENSQNRNGKTHEDSTILIAGDGMGGKKGTNRSWLYNPGDEDTSKVPTARKVNLTAAQKTFWEF